MPQVPFVIDEPTAQFLVSEEGGTLLDAVAALPGDAAQRVLLLRKRGIAPALAAGAVEVAGARQRARRRFPQADRLFFDASALAQATSPPIAAYHAALLAPFAAVADLGCSVGMDAIALAQAGARVVAVERDPVRLHFARANALIFQVTDRIDFRLGDAAELDWQADAAFWDPSRRVDGDRVSRHAERYEPPLSFLKTIRSRVQGGCVKLSPALPDDLLQSLGTVEFLSENRECKEACVVFGTARREDAPPNAVLLPEATVLPGNASDSVAAAPTPGEYVFDPDPAVVRAGALATLARMLEAQLLSRADAYLTGDRLSASRDARRAASAYRVVDILPYKPRIVGAWLRARGVGRLIVKKRHFPLEPDAVARELGLSGKGGIATLLLARQEDGGHLAVVCEPVI